MTGLERLIIVPRGVALNFSRREDFVRIGILEGNDPFIFLD